MSKIIIQRVYEANPPYCSPTYLIDRLWPRGISKTRLEGVIWSKEVAPSNELRIWYHAHLDEWVQFKEKYLQELEKSSSWSPLYSQLTLGHTITLLYGSKNEQQNHAIILRDFLLSKFR
nr:DUF488 family protein [Zophobihabitans entericus]